MKFTVNGKALDLASLPSEPLGPATFTLPDLPSDISIGTRLTIKDASATVTGSVVSVRVEEYPEPVWIEEDGEGYWSRGTHIIEWVPD